MQNADNKIPAIINIFKDKLNSNEILPDTVLDDANIDSIKFIEIVVALEIEYDFEFDDEMLLISNFPTVNSIIEYVGIKTPNIE